MNTAKDALPAPVDPKAKKAAKSDTDVELEGLMSEIETDLREEELKKIWNNYGSIIITFVVLMVVAVAGFQFYKYSAEQQRADAARRYNAAMTAQQDGKTDEALAQFTLLGQNGGKGYGALARLNQASLQIQKKDFDGAVATYTAIAADGTVDPVFRDLATLLRVLHSLDREDAKKLEASVVTLVGHGKAFNLSALELQALLAAKQGDTARAAKALAMIVEDNTAPPSMKQRASDLTKLYESGVTPPPPAAPAIPAPAPSAPPAASATPPSKVTP